VVDCIKSDIFDIQNSKFSYLCLYVPKKCLELNFVHFVTDLVVYLVCQLKLTLEHTMKAQEGSIN
jgi:hypothetical protein